ncbi:hypothetical protein GGF43_005815 [Coemansia sp. RSA 2618]|nr:hypothetical protein GGF43_005815 [Coemansia sp. RSA 2618]
MNFRGHEVDIPESGFLGACADVDGYEKLSRVGEGTYGIVYKARETRTGRIVALKRMRTEEHGLPLSSLREIALLKRLKHANIVDVLGVVGGHSLESIFMVMEFCDNDLGTMLDSMDTPFAAGKVRDIMRQLLSGLAYCHENHVVHRDLKLANVLMTRVGAVKIADFGMARVFHEGRPMTPHVATLWYRAPELLLGAAEYTAAVDMWSAGCIFGELLVHRPFMAGRTEQEQMRLIAETIGAPNERIWPGFSRLPLAQRMRMPDCRYNKLKLILRGAGTDTVLLLNSMLTYAPAKRIGAQRARAHAYFGREE